MTSAHPIDRTHLTHTTILQSPTPSPQIPLEPVSRSKWRSGGSNYLGGLQALPEIRKIPWAPGKELPPEKSTQSPRVQTRGAFLLSTRGRINNPPCTHCATGVGRFLYCISLDSWFQNACSTCVMGTRGNFCSLRTQSANSRSTSPSNPRYTLNNLPPSSSQPQSPLLLNSAKRKRVSSSAQSPLQASLSPANNQAIPANLQTHSRNAQGNITLYEDPSFRAIHPPTKLGTASSTQNSYTTRFAPPYIGPKITQVASSRQSIAQLSSHVTSKQSSSLPQYSYDATSASLVDFASTPPSKPLDVDLAQNQQRLLHSHPQENKDQFSNSGEIEHQRSTVSRSANSGSSSQSDQENSESASPSEQLLGARVHGITNVDQPVVEEPEFRNTFPRSKHKQVLDLVEGLQNGILSAKEQAGTMQKQLDDLKSVLGLNGLTNSRR